MLTRRLTLFQRGVPLHEKRDCDPRGTLPPLEVLHVALVLLRGLACRKRAEIAAFAGARVDLARVEAIFARRKLADHDGAPESEREKKSIGRRRAGARRRSFD